MRTTGKRPFQYRYEHLNVNGRDKTTRSIQDGQTSTGRATLPLSSVPGQHEYRLLQVADANYGFQPNFEVKQAVFTIEQTILDRPTALLTNRGSLVYCLYDRFDKRKTPPQVEFTGQAPFSIRVEASDTKKVGKRVFEVDQISQTKWDFELPAFTFDSAGTYVFTIVSISDATGCAWEPMMNSERSIRVAVVEPARIQSASPRSHYCVGDTLEYFLQGTSVVLSQPRSQRLMSALSGTSPWTIGSVVIVPPADCRSNSLRIHVPQLYFRGQGTSHRDRQARISQIGR